MSIELIMSPILEIDYDIWFLMLILETDYVLGVLGNPDLVKDVI